MVDELKSLVIQQLRVVFPQVKKVYDEPVQQGLQVPAFLVLIINDIQERKLNRRMVQEFTFNITYFPSDERMFYTESDPPMFKWLGLNIDLRRWILISEKWKRIVREA